MGIYGGCYRWPRRHTVELDGRTVRFSSYYRPGFWLESDAIQAAKDAGMYERRSDARRMRLDGMPLSR